VLVEAAALLAAMRIALRLSSVRRVHAVLAATSARRRSPLAPGTIDGHRAAALVAMADRGVGLGTTCLHRSLTLWWLLRRRGVDANLHMGIRQSAGRIEGHAWVEAAGLVLDDPASNPDEYVPFDASWPRQPIA
jgi:hypothetical protein